MEAVDGLDVSVSFWRAGQNIDEIATPPYSQKLVSRVNSWSGNGVAIAGGLIGGGFLFHLWRPAPFLVAAFVVCVACAVPILLVTEDGGHGRVFEGVRAYVAQSWRVLRSNRDVATFLVANTAWEGTFAGARTFVVLYVTVGLGEPLVDVERTSSARSPAATSWPPSSPGRSGDRVGFARVITVLRPPSTASGLLAGGLGDRGGTPGTSRVIFFVAIAGGTGDDPHLGAPLQADARRASGARSPASRPQRRASGSWIGPLAAGGP